MKYDIEIEFLRLTELKFEELESDGQDSTPSFTMEVELDQGTQEITVMSWVLTFEFSSIFRIRALYLAYISSDDNVFDKEETISATYYGVLSEFAVLIATLTKSFGSTPLIMEAKNLMDLGGYKV